MSERADFNDQPQEVSEAWAVALAEATLPEGQRPVGGPQVDSPLATTQRAFQALDLDERKEFLLWLAHGAPGIW